MNTTEQMNQDICSIKKEILEKQFPRCLEKIKGQKNLPNPGGISDLHTNFKSIMPLWFSGIEIGGQKNLAANRSIYGNWSLSHVSPTGFRLGGYYSPNYKGDIIQCPHIHATINPRTFLTNFSLLYSPYFNVLCEFRSQSRLKYNENMLKIDRYGKLSTVSLTFYNPARDVGGLSLGYLHSLTSHLSIGSEVYFEFYKTLSNLNGSVSIAANYQHDQYTIATTCSIDAFDLTYWRKVTKKLNVGSALVYNKKQNNVVGSIYYQVRMPDSTVRGMINSQYKLGCTYDRLIPNLGFQFGCSVLYNVANNKFTTGLKFIIDSNLNFK